MIDIQPLDLEPSLADRLTRALAEFQSSDQNDPDQPVMRWQALVECLRECHAPPEVYRLGWETCFRDWTEYVTPMWFPTPDLVRSSNVYQWQHRFGDPEMTFSRWAAGHREEFWKNAIEELQIVFDAPAEDILDESQGVENAVWLSGARLNIVNSCFQADVNETAIVAQAPEGPLRKTSYGELRRLTNRVSNSVVNAGFQPGDALAVVMPMTALSIPIYLGVIQAGCSIVSIADSFAPPEIATRIRISQAKSVFVYDVQRRAGKTHPLFDRVAQATELPAVVISNGDELACELREQDQRWTDFLVQNDEFAPHNAEAAETINILFSSGTTGDPKAIPWTHLTPIKCASDGYCHHDIRPRDVCVWPTNLGWMMGPWLIFATLINRATIGLYEDSPIGKDFGRFVEAAQVNMLGVVPTIVKAWRKTRCQESHDWSTIKLFSSTGESSLHDDMFYLSSLAGMKPVVEYCGGTEIGGGYVSSLITLPNVASAFNTPAIGLDFVLLDENDQVSDEGEVFLAGPSLGLSQTLLNRDHHETYFAGTPRIEGLGTLRRHGDHFKRIPSGSDQYSYYVAGGRVDDTMNLGGIKISSAEIERILNQIDGVKETAAVAVAKNGGPSELVVFTVTEVIDEIGLRGVFNQCIREALNPLFKITRVERVDSLPRTASGKVMRRRLRAQLEADA